VLEVGVACDEGVEVVAMTERIRSVMSDVLVEHAFGGRGRAARVAAAGAAAASRGGGRR
jgi:hypothetical protein